MTTFTTLSSIGAAVELDARQLEAASRFFRRYRLHLERGHSLDGFDTYYDIKRVYLANERMHIVFAGRAYQLFSDTYENDQHPPLLIGGVIFLRNSRGSKPSILRIVSVEDAADVVWMALHEIISVHEIEQVS